MQRASRLRWGVLSLTLGSVLLPRAASADLKDYVNAPDPSYAWKLERTMDLPDGVTAYVVGLTSQTWRGLDWKHDLVVLVPAKVTHKEHALLWITGGSNRETRRRDLPGDAVALARIAQATESVTAAVFQVPNQPLFGDLYEDALISHTFEQFMKTGDETWPCLLPMTKSAVRAMDAVQALAKRECSQEIRRFVVTGASKRGWTTWLTGAVDPRVAAIAPMVIDVLNMKEQMPHQVLSFGRYSEKIADYSDKSLPDRLQQPEAKGLLDLVDPYSYRAKLTMPKLILLGTNDRYWPVDAVKLYFGDLKGEKHIHYVPNKGHGLGTDAVVAVGAFYDGVLRGRSLPRFRWTTESTDDAFVLRIEADDPPVSARLWSAAAATRDFRDSKWSADALSSDVPGRFVATIPSPKAGYAAVFGQLTYRSPLGYDYTLCTSVDVIEPAEASRPAAGSLSR